MNGEHIKDNIIMPFHKNECDNNSFIKNEECDIPSEMKDIPISKLIPHSNYVFPLLNEIKLDELARSISRVGVLQPITVRKADNEGKYEILSGHNRVKASEILGNKTIPAKIIEVPDEIADLIVTEANLRQRVKEDMSHSQLAKAIHNHYEAEKKAPGYISKLISEIEGMQCAPLEQGGRTRDKASALYGMSKSEIARYLRFYKLIDKLKGRLDDGSISKRTAEWLSYLKNAEQEVIEDILSKGSKINMNQAKEIKKLSQTNQFSIEEVEKILASTDIPNSKSHNIVVLSDDILHKYFNPEQTNGEINDIIDKALEQFLNAQIN